MALIAFCATRKGSPRHLRAIGALALGYTASWLCIERFLAEVKDAAVQIIPAN